MFIHPKARQPSRLRPLTAAILAGCLSAPALSATFTVNSTGDAVDSNPGDGICATAGGDCTLRAAIEEANALAGADNIHFNIGGGGPVTLTATSNLPSITGVTAIDGYTQPGSSPNTLAQGSNAVINVRLDGGNTIARAVYFQNSLSSGSSVRGLAITRFAGAAIGMNGAHGVTAAGNFVGTDGTAAADLGNEAGILVHSNADDAVVGGSSPADRNVVAFNQTNGIWIDGTNVANALIRNNYIGTAPDGITPHYNGRSGIHIDGASGTTVRDNVIASTLSAIRIVNGGALSTTIHGNAIGVGADGATPIGGGEGIAVLDGASGSPDTVWVGGIDPGQANVIANTQGAGVRVDRTLAGNVTPPAAVAIRGNAIYNNAGMGIDLGDSATGTGVGVPNANDAGDLDAGANYFQNFPVVTSATTNGTVTTVSFTYDTYALGGFWVDVYASPSCDASGHGEGRVFLAAATLPTDDTGHLSATFDALPATTVGHYITLTATDTLLWATSEFSACVQVTAGGGGGGSTPPVMGNVPDQSPTVGTPFTLDVSPFVTLTDGDAILSFAYTGTLPPGLSFNTATGVFSGTPTTAGVFSVGVTAQDKDGASASDAISFSVASSGGGAVGGSLQFEVSALTVNESAGTATLTVTRTGGASGAVGVQYATAPGSATSPADFAAVSGTLLWADGDASPKTITVPIVNDGVAEGHEQFTVVLTDIPSDTASLGSPSTLTVTIADDAPSSATPVPTLGLLGQLFSAFALAISGLWTRRKQVV